jgi:hypothetical protein
VDGNGSHAGVRNGTGRNVVVWGLPGRLPANTLRSMLRNYKLAGSGSAGQEVFKIEKSISAFLSSNHADSPDFTGLDHNFHYFRDSWFVWIRYQRHIDLCGDYI